MAEAVLHLLDCLNPGGTERQMIEQCKRIDRARFRPLVAAFHQGGTLVGELDQARVPVAAFPLHGSLAHPNTAWQAARIAHLARRERVRIIHAHDFYANLVGAAIARLAGAKLVASRRDLMHWLSPAKRRALGWACRTADRVVANAAALARATVDELGVRPERVRLVPNGLDLAQFDADASNSPDPPLPEAPHPTVAVVSNLNLPDKGHADLLEAAARLAAAGRPITLLLVGDGAERGWLAARATGLGLDVRFLGRRRDVPRLLARVDAACLPSWAEGFPNAVIEAMAAARPVVATAVGGTPEAITDGEDGLLVPPRDPAALADALGRVLGDAPRARAMGRRARATVEARFSIDRAAKILDALYEELAA